MWVTYTARDLTPYERKTDGTSMWPSCTAFILLFSPHPAVTSGDSFSFRSILAVNESDLLSDWLSQTQELWSMLWWRTFSIVHAHFFLFEPKQMKCQTCHPENPSIWLLTAACNCCFWRKQQKPLSLTFMESSVSKEYSFLTGISYNCLK